VPNSQRAGRTVLTLNNKTKYKTIVIVPTLNGGKTVDNLAGGLKKQSLQPDNILIIDSGSTDNTLSAVEMYGFTVYTIPQCQFNHGSTRQFGVQVSQDSDIIIFLTQDAILAERDSLRTLVDCFNDDRVGMAYGRQLPVQNASAISAHARLFNYPEKNQMRSPADITRFGIKAVFCSNSFAAYRRAALTSVGGFPENIIQNEDTFVCAKMLLGGWSVAYCANAQVYHSHDYTCIDEFKRYFDIGVFHSRNKWIMEAFGSAENEGRKYVISELKYLAASAPYAIPASLLHTLFKYLGYKFGFSIERHLPPNIKRKLSMNKAYWTSHCNKSISSIRRGTAI